jgi:hypothetical protein
MMLLANCGALVTALLGCLGLLFPAAVCRILGVSAQGPLGGSEARAPYGGFFLCLGIGCFVAQSPSAFTVVGAAWCAAAAARAERCRYSFDREPLFAVVRNHAGL